MLNCRRFPLRVLYGNLLPGLDLPVQQNMTLLTDAAFATLPLPRLLQRFCSMTDYVPLGGYLFTTVVGSNIVYPTLHTTVRDDATATFVDDTVRDRRIPHSHATLRLAVIQPRTPAAGWFCAGLPRTPDTCRT